MTPLPSSKSSPLPEPPSCSPLSVHCKFDAIVALDAHTPHPKNDNVHTPEQIALFVKILKRQGIRRAAVVSKESGHFVTGHGLRESLLAMGVTGIPVDYQSFASEKEELAHLMADNQLGKLATRNDDLTEANLQELNGDDFDLTLAGFTEDDLDAFDLDPDEDDAPSTTKLVALKPREYPKRAWALVGIDVADFGKIQTMLDQLPEQAIVRVTRSDYEPKQNRQPQSLRKARSPKAPSQDNTGTAASP